MINLPFFEQTNHKILVIGNHKKIIQSIFDFDYLCQKNSPSIVAIIASGRKYERYFFGKKELLIPVFSSLEKMSSEFSNSLTLFLHVSSARRVVSQIDEIFTSIPNIKGGVIFAENLPEKHALSLFDLEKKHNKFIIGPASVGIVFPGSIKLGAIGGVEPLQIIESHLLTKGDVAIFSASGGMTNEIISQVTRAGHRVSFALHFGGDRFPLITPKDAFLLAEKDSSTKTIIYFGELGGTDEYEIAKLLQTKQVTKKVLCYIAGTISEYFATPPQFGHAKAMAKTHSEGAREKRIALKKVGAIVAESFEEFIIEISKLQLNEKLEEKSYTTLMNDLTTRRSALITTSISKDTEGMPMILGEDLLKFSQENSFANIVTSLFLGKKIISKETENFVDFVLRLLVDHGPYVSGAVNTIITARAGRDLVSSLSSGLLTIGPRFGGAINEAAGNWLTGSSSDVSAYDFVESFASQKKYIAGIGHKKYRVDIPDPRVKELLKFAEKLEKKRFTTFAKDVEKITVSKKGNLILNVDGTIAAVLLDLLSEKEMMDDHSLSELVNTEFFNALFVLSRSVGFIAHFLDQKRIDEGLFRLDEDLVAEATTTTG